MSSVEYTMMPTFKDATQSRGILVVDDDEDIRETLKEMLGEHGFEAICKANGKEALDYLEVNPPPFFILLDLMMPVMSGWDFLKVHMRDPKISDIPVILMSANLELIRNETLLGYDKVPKPFPLEKLFRLVSEFCARASSSMIPVAGDSGGDSLMGEEESGAHVPAHRQGAGTNQKASSS